MATAVFLPCSTPRSSVAAHACAYAVATASAEVDALKSSLKTSIAGLNRGIFGVPTSRKLQIEELIGKLEHVNPCPEPTANLEQLLGEWKLLYSTISILGSKRTKLGLRDLVSLDEFIQAIDEDKARNVIGFSAFGLGMLKGSLTIDASYRIASAKRVDIEYESSTIVPKQLLKLFEKNYELLLSIFNPAGWLEITYLDGSWRIGRDNKGNIFLVEKL